MTTATTRFLLLVLACLCRVLSYGQANSPQIRTADQANFTSFTQRISTSKAAWEKFNQPSDYKHPEFGVLPPDAPCTECVELLGKRKADERIFIDYRNPSEQIIQKSMGDMSHLQNGQWITIEDRLKKIGPGHYRSAYYAEPVGVEADARRTYIQTPQGKIYFNQWSLYAKTASGEVLLANADWSHYTAGDDGVYISNIFKGIDAELRVYRGSLKTSFIMKKNAYGVFEQLIFRDQYNSGKATRVAFTGNGTQQTGTGALDVYSGDAPLLHVNEAVIYPKGAAANSVLTATYAVKEGVMDILVPYRWIEENIGQHELVIDPTVTGSATLNTAAIAGSRYNASCSFDSSCNYNLSVNIPAATTVTGVLYSFTYNASAPCFGSDGGVRFSTGNCATQIFTNQSQTPGPTIMTLVPITNEMQACIPAPSCAAQSLNFNMHFYRSCKGLSGCDNNCIGAGAPWIMTIKAKTVEFNDPQEPISYTANNICMGDSIYVSTWASYGVAPYNYSWSFNPSGTPSLGTGASTSITFPNIVNNTIYAIITDACNNTAIDSLPITVNYAAVTATPPNDTICSGQTTAISLSAPVPGTTFSWTVTENGVTGAAAGSGNSINQVLTTTGNTPGTVIYTITPQNVGCTGASITVPITVYPLMTGTSNITICANQLPYNWNGQNVTAGGTGAATYTTPSLLTGCDSTTTLNLTVNPVLSVTQNQTICASQLPYTWNGFTLTSGGNGVATYTTSSSAFNCDSITILNLNVVNTLTVAVDASVCASQLPYLWNGISVLTGGANAATYTTTSAISGCDSTTTLNLTVHALPQATDTRVICADQLPYSWNGQTIAAGGTGVATYTTSSLLTGCDSTTTLNLFVHPLIHSNEQITICANQLPYTWNGQQITAGGSNIATYTTASLVTGCDSTVHLNLTVNPVQSLAHNVTVCANQLPYSWNGFTLTAGGASVATYTTSSLVTGCDSTVVLNLQVNPVLTSTVNNTICANQLPYTWNGVTVTAGGAAAATYTATSFITGCDSIVTLNLTVNPVLTATVTRTICANQLPYTWNGQTITAGGPAVATFTTASLVTACDSITTLNLLIQPEQSITVTRTICPSQLPYTWNGYTLTSGGNAVATYVMPSSLTGCDSSTILNLVISPVQTATETLTICTTQLPYTWNNITVNAPGAGAASFTTTGSSGCDSITTLDLNVYPVLNATDHRSICTGQLPYTWNGIVVNTAGPAAAVFLTTSLVTGCDSSVTLNLSINPVLSDTVHRAICAGQLPYTWNGITITAAGPAAAVYTSTTTAGCDSITTLDLTVNPVLTNTVQQTICANQLPYTWNGITVTAAGNNAAVFTTTGSSGCDSITTLNLTVNPVLTATVHRTICANQLPYSWNGITVNAGGTNAATYTAPSALTGCDSITTLDLTVNPVLQASQQVTICSSQLPYSWNGQNVTAGGTAAATYTIASAVTGCDSITTLNLTVIPAIQATQQVTVCAGQMPYTWNGIVVTAGGTNAAVFTATSAVTQCDSITTLNLTVTPAITAVQNITVCNGQLPYTWNGIILTAGGNNAATYTTAAAGTGCDSVTTLNLNVIPALTATQQVTICSAQLPYTWNGISVTAGGSSAATYTMTLPSGCDSITTLNLTVSQAYTTAIDTSICFTEAPMVWNGQTYSNSGTYVQTFTAASGCDSVVTLSLLVKAAPVVLPSTVLSGCGQISFGDSLYRASTIVRDTFFNEAGCDSVYRTTIIKVYQQYADTTEASICAYDTYTWNGETYNQSGWYTKQFMTPSGCDSILNLDLTVWPSSQIRIEKDLDDVPCEGDTLTVTASGGVEYNWKWNGQQAGTGSTGNIVLSEKVNEIYVSGLDENGCTSDAATTVTTKACCDMMIPNAFSPNGDGNNDGFGPETLGNPKEFKMMIFNRYGQLLFTSISIGNKWDGTYLGKAVDLGTYFYRIVTKCSTNEENTFKGDITLIR